MPTIALPFPVIDPIAIEIGPLAIRWYALAFIAALFFAWFYVRRLAAIASVWGGREPPLTRLDVDDWFLWAAIGVILGGRTGYVLFYNLPHYLAHPLEIFALWQGGMSFHGGLIGVTAASIIFGIRRQIGALTMLDLAAAATPLGLFFGRLANFINAELYGRITDMPWGIVFPGAGPDPRHPSQLYQGAMEGLLLFAIMLWLVHGRRSLTRPGLITGVFALGYGAARILAEFFREPDPQLGFLWGPLTMGMLLSIPLLCIGAGLLWYARRKATTA